MPKQMKKKVSFFNSLMYEPGLYLKLIAGD